MNIKETTSQVQSYLLALLPYFLIGLVWIGTGIIILQITKADLQEQINETWEQAIQIDCRNRRVETGYECIRGYAKDTSTTTSSITTFTMGEQETHFDKDTLPTPADEIERDSRATQHVLLEENPINPVRLDSLFNTLLNKKDISASTAVFYLHNTPNSLPRCSVQDTTFFAQAFATKEIKTSIDNSIVLRGFVGLSCINYIQYDLSFYLLWLCSGILIILIMVYQYRKKSKQEQHLLQLPAPEVPVIVGPNTVEPVTLPATIYYQKYNYTLIYGELSILLTPMEDRLFLGLIEREDYYWDYESMISKLWKKDSGDKKKLEQQRRNLKAKLDQTSVITLKTVREKGYRLIIAKNTILSFDESAKPEPLVTLN